MKEFLSKILGISIINISNASIGFLITYFIIQFFSLKILGEYTVFLSLVGIFSIGYNSIPANFSVIKLQDDKKFDKLLFGNYILTCLIITPLLILFFWILNINYNPLVSLLFIFSLGLQNYLDVFCQANSKLKFYYRILLVLSLARLLIILIFSFHISDFNSLIYGISLLHFFVVLFIFYMRRELLLDYVKKPKTIINSVYFVYENYKEFKGYYFNSLVKKVRTNSLVLIFSIFTSDSLIGLFSLFVKVNTFSNGLFRTIEAFLMNKENQTKYIFLFKKISLLIGMALLLVNFIIGIIYLKINVGEYYFLENFLLSTLSFSYISYMNKRILLLSNYSNSILNKSELFFVIVTILFSGVFFIFEYNKIYSLLITFYFSTLTLQLFTIYNAKNQNHFREI